MQQSLQAPQKILGRKGLLIVIATMMAVMPLSVDLYLPALPKMVAYFDTSEEMVNLTLILYVIIFSLSMLIWGPMSDKYGRKPVLNIGLIIFTIFSIGCANATTIEMMNLFRFFQGMGAGAVVAIIPAIVKDSFAYEQREKALAWVQTMVITAPVVAPSIGAFLMKITSWQGIFWILALIAIFSLLLAQLITETNLEKFEGNILKSLSRLGVVLQNKKFFQLLMIFSAVMMPALAFVAGSSYIFIQDFGLDEQGYGAYYMIDAVFRVLGPFFYLLLVKFFPRHLIIRYSFVTIAITGILIGILGTLHPLWFAISVIPLMLVGTMVRTPGTNLMLQQVDKDSGTASSLINAIGALSGTLGMVIISIDLGSKIITLAAITFCVGTFLTITWFSADGKSYDFNVKRKAIST